MPGGTRTAPTVDASPSWRTVSISYIDYTGDVRTDTYKVDDDTIVAEVEAFIVATQLLTNASITRVVVGDVFSSVPSKANALEEVWENVKDNVVVLEKTALDVAQDFYIPSPIEGMFVDGTENLDPAYGAFVTWLAAITPFRAAYSQISARLTHRKQIGKKINI